LNRIRRSFQLLGQCFAVLRQDPELLLFPIVSVICFVAVVASFVLPLLATQGGAALTHGAGHLAFSTAHWLVLGAFYFLTYFVIAFFNVALVSCAGIRLNGGDPTLGDGLRAAFSRIGTIAAWVAVAASVGWLLRTLEEKAGFLGKIVIALIGTAWSLATALVVPVLAFERVGPVDSVKRSISLLKETWGEQIVGDVGLGVLTFFGIMASVVIGGGGAVLLPQLWYVPVVLGVCLLAVTLVLQATLKGIFQAALYVYATTGQVRGGFDDALIQQAFRTKRKR
jgi:hypothetical protein